MKCITGTEKHLGTGKQVEFSAEYRLAIGGVRYSAVFIVEDGRPSRVVGFLAWSLKVIPPSRAVERTVRHSVQFLDVSSLLVG